MVLRARRALRPVRRTWREASRPLRDRIATRVALARMPPPVTFNEKVRYKMLADRRPLLTTFADKLASREYVASKVGAHLLTELHAVTSDPATLPDAGLPPEFVLKPTHASGACVVVASFAPPAGELPELTGPWTQALVTPAQLRWDRLVGLCEAWIGRSYNSCEWAYRNVPRRILVEELLEDEGSVPFDYKLFVFHGRVRLIQVSFDRYEAHTRNLYTPEWERLPVEYGGPAGRDVAPPSALLEMRQIAEALGSETDFVRVDLYCLGERVVFGELTNYPFAGAAEFTPAEFDRELGKWWTVPRRYKRYR
jgi:hypothetical protein